MKSWTKRGDEIHPTFCAEREWAWMHQEGKRLHPQQKRGSCQSSGTRYSFQPYFFLFRFSEFYSSVLKLLLLSCHLHSVTKPIQCCFFLNFCYCSFQFSILHLLLTPISLWRFSAFSLVSREFVIACWNIFITAALQCMSNNSNIWFIWVLVSFHCLFSCKLWLSWFLIWQVIFYCISDIWAVALGNSRLYLNLPF